MVIFSQPFLNGFHIVFYVLSLDIKSDTSSFVLKFSFVNVFFPFLII